MLHSGFAGTRVIAGEQNTQKENRGLSPAVPVEARSPYRFGKIGSSGAGRHGSTTVGSVRPGSSTQPQDVEPASKPAWGWSEGWDL